jgi:hypothetical protein
MKIDSKQVIIAAVVALPVGVAIWIAYRAIYPGEQVTPVTAAAAWKLVLKNCAQNQTFRPNNMVYLGPSNSTGAGTIWRSVEGGGYELKRLPPNFSEGTVHAGEWSACAGTSPASFAVESGADGAVLSKVKGGSGTLAADLKRARTVNLKVDAWRQVELVGDAFSDWVEKLPVDDTYKLSLLRQDRVVAYRVVEVKGMTAILTFDEAAAAEIRGKYGSEGNAEGTAGLKVNFKGGNTLVITAPDVFVIEAEFGTYSPSSGDFKGGFAPLESIENAPVTSDLESP